MDDATLEAAQRYTDDAFALLTEEITALRERIEQLEKAVADH